MLIFVLFDIQYAHGIEYLHGNYLCFSMINELFALKDNAAKIIALNINILMKTFNVSETQLAKALGVSVMTIRRVLSGETEDPRISTLSLIANYFNISVDSLLKINNGIPINLMKKQKPFFVPILEWNTIKDGNYYKKINFSTWGNWYPIINNDSINLNEKSFILESKISMQPKYPNGTLLIIKPDEIPLDNDIVLVKAIQSCDLSLRELIIDSPKSLLQPIIVGSELIYYNKEEYDIIGVVVLTVFQARD